MKKEKRYSRVRLFALIAIVGLVTLVSLGSITLATEYEDHGQPSLSTSSTYTAANTTPPVSSSSSSSSSSSASTILTASTTTQSSDSSSSSSSSFSSTSTWSWSAPPIPSLPSEISGCPLPRPIPTTGYNIAPGVKSLNSSQRYVVLRFDDSLQSQWLNVLPILQKYDYKAMFLAITSSLQPNGTGYPLAYAWDTMSWTEMEYLYDHGYEIADHTATHADLNSQSCSGLDFQIYGSRQALFEHNMTFVPVLVDPSANGASNLTVVDYTYASGYSFIYPITQYSNTPEPIWYDMDVFGNPTQSLSYFETAVNQSNSSSVVGVYYHNVNDHMPCCSPFYVNTTTFAQEMSYLYENNFTVILPDQLPWY